MISPLSYLYLLCQIRASEAKKELTQSVDFGALVGIAWL